MTSIKTEKHDNKTFLEYGASYGRERNIKNLKDTVHESLVVGFYGYGNELLGSIKTGLVFE
jgi:hypothetical protein